MAGDNLGNTDMVVRTTTAAQTSGANTTGGKLWLPIWSGEVINAYDEYNMFESVVTQRTIPSGTTIEIPITGTVGLNAAWDAGEELIGGTSTATTFKVTLDKRPMAAHFEIDNVDLMLSQWEFRSELARQAALTLANARDRQLYSALVQAGLEGALANDPRPSIMSGAGGDSGADFVFGGSDLAHLGVTASTEAQRSTAAIKVLAEIEKYIVKLQENNISYDKLFLVVNPQAFMDIRALGIARSTADLGGSFSANYGADATQSNQSGGASNPMFGGNVPGSLGGPLTQGYGQLADTLEYMGCTIVKSNRVVYTDQGSATNVGEAKYGVNYADAKIMAVMFTPEAVAGIRLQGLKVDTVDDVRRNTTFTVASMMGGTGIMRPECAAVISGLDVTNASFDTRAELKVLADITAGIGHTQG